MKILAINPGGTSTKVAVFEDTQEVFTTSIVHDAEKLSAFATVFDEFPYRLSVIEETLQKENHKLDSFDAIVGRGGLVRPIPGGTYYVSESMIEDLRNQVHGEHASNLGPVLAKHLADKINKPSFVVDPVAVDELQEISRISGLSDLERPSWFHALNHKAVCRRVSSEMGGKYEDFNFIVAHLGSGISVVAHEKGRMIDGSGGRTNGPFSPERCGGLPAYSLIELCYSGKYTRDELVKKISFHGGMYDYLGTKDAYEVEQRSESGDEKARLIFDAFCYQVSCEIAMYGASLCGKVDRIILTGGIARSKPLEEEVKRRLSYLAPIVVIPGEMEMEALALGALRVLTNEELAKIYDNEILHRA